MKPINDPIIPDDTSQSSGQSSYPKASSSASPFIVPAIIVLAVIAVALILFAR